MTISSLSKNFRSFTERVLDFYYNWASSTPGFLRLILSIRFLVLLIITINFGFILKDPSTLKTVTSCVIWLYFLFILFLLFIAFLKPDKFESKNAQRWQVFLDGLVIAFIYAVSVYAKHQPDPNIFLFYFLPLLVTARFLGIRTLILLMLYITTTSSVTWALLLDHQNIVSPEYWFQNLLPQFGFLTILTIFYMIYYRRRKMGERLQTLTMVVEDQIGQLWQGSFSVDSDLKITAMDSAMQQRHSIIQNETTCAQAFCSESLQHGISCSECPLNKALLHKEAASAELQFTDRTGTKYSAQVSAYPILNNDQAVIGVNAWIKDLDEQKTLIMKQRMLTENLERVIDQNRQDDRAHVQRLVSQLEAISQASESALSPDLFSGADEIVRAMVLLLGCRLATVRQYQVDAETGREGLVLCNYFGLDPIDVSRISFLDLSSASLTVKAFKSGADQYVENFQKSGLIKFDDLLQSYGLRSMACFPLKIQGKGIGTFTLFRSKAQGFSAEDLQMGRAIANIMASLVASQRSIQKDQGESQRRKRELDILSVLSQKLVTINDPQVLAQLVADTVRIELHTETAAVFLKHANFLQRFAMSGIDQDWFKDEAYQIGQGLTGRVAIPNEDEIFGKRLLENDLENSDLVIPENLLRYKHKLASGAVRHLLAVPLNGLAGTFGVLRVVNKLDTQDNLDKQGFSEHESELLMTIACIVAVAMENARLFEVEKRKRQLEKALRHGTRNLSSTLEEEQILFTILEQLKNVVHYDTASLFLLEPEGLRLKSMAGFSEEDERQLRDICLNPDFNPPFQKMKTDHQPILKADLWDEPFLESIIGTASIRSWIGAPLIIKDQIIGWLSVDNWKPKQYTLEDMNIAMDFAQQAAIAIDNARRYNYQKEQAVFLMELETHLVEITSATDKKETLNCVAQAAQHLMNCEIAGVALYDKEKKEIRALPGTGHIGVPEDYVHSFSFPVDHQGGLVLREKKVFRSKDASADPQSIFGHRLVDSIGVKGVIASPLMVGEHIVGVLYAASHLPKNWTDSQIAFFSILSNHAAIAIRNSELLDVKERRAQLLNLLHHLSIAGQLINEPEVIYNILLTAVTAEYGLRFNRALLLLFDKEHNLLKGVTGIGQIENSDAYRVWENLDANSHSFETYIGDVLSNGISNYTPLHYKAKNLEIPIRVQTNEVFSRVFLSKKVEVVDPSIEQGNLDENFYRIFDSKSFVVVPLLVNNEVVGMLVVDNKMWLSRF